MLFANQSMFNKHLLFGMGYENLEEEESQIQKFKKKKNETMYLKLLMLKPGDRIFLFSVLEIFYYFFHLFLLAGG